MDEDSDDDNKPTSAGAMDFLQVKEMVGEREIIRMKFPGTSGVDVNILPPTPRHSPPPPDGEQPPKIRYKPLDADIRPGSDAVFELVVSDSTGVCVSWMKNNNLLFSVGHNKIWSSGNSFFLKITNVTEKDEALYDYVVRNEVGETKGDVQLLVNEDSSEYEDDDDDEEEEGEGEEQDEVKQSETTTTKISSKQGKELNNSSKKEKIVLEPCFLQRLKHEYVILEGCPLELVVETEGQPIEVAWFYEGRKLKNSGSEFITMTTEKNVHRLHIGEAVYDDEGFYECVASYDNNCEITTSTDIIIETNPRDDVSNTSELDDLDLEYTMTGSPVIHSQ